MMFVTNPCPNWFAIAESLDRELKKGGDGDKNVKTTGRGLAGEKSGGKEWAERN
jgi:hypothetical protein